MISLRQPATATSQPDGIMLHLPSTNSDLTLTPDCCKEHRNSMLLMHTPDTRILIVMSRSQGKKMEIDQTKRQRHDESSNSMSHSQILTVHTVTCDNTKLHQYHPTSQDYLDVPRLFEGDSKASPLRGRMPIDDVDEILEDDEAVSIILYRRYSCNEYHAQMQDFFQSLQQPKHPSVHTLLPYFFYLREHGSTACATTEQVELVSDDLKNALSKMTGMSRESLDDLKDVRNMNKLYNHFYFYRQDLDKYISNLDLLERQQITVFQQFMEQTFGTEYQEADSLFSKGRVSEKHLLKLLRSGEMLVTYKDGQPMAYVIDEYHDAGIAGITVNCHSWNFDGAFYQEKSQLYINCPWPSKEIDIENLEVYPLQFDTTNLKGRLRKRGETFWKCRHGKYVAYSPPHTTFEFQTTNPRYMVDVQTYEQIHPKTDVPHREYTGPSVADEHVPEEHFLLQLPSTIRGFGFHDKKWRTLLVDHIGDITWNSEAFNHLVLSHSKKELIQALIASHSGSGGKSSTDVIEGKGNGLILLLHGGPGTGKTLTAESVAELTHRPLYRVTCGDIGTNPEDVENYLESVFYLGTKWNCVVLLDEADIFLEERMPTDLQRNALVSVFLRVLEYYEGILILTSNRIGTFDEAFKSRVHLTLHYPPLDLSGRRRIWNNFLGGLQQESDVSVQIDELRDKIDDLSENKLNGREIRNAIKTAKLLAQFRKETLAYGHLKEVIKISDEFEQYLIDIHGHSFSEWAKAQRTRAE